MDGQTFQFSVKKTKWKENPSKLEDFSFQKDILSDYSWKLMESRNIVWCGGK